MKKEKLTILLLIVIGFVSLSLKGQSIKDFYIPLNYNKANFYKPDKSGERSDFTRVIEYHNNEDGSYSIYSEFTFKGDLVSKNIERIIFTTNSVIRTKSIFNSAFGGGDREQTYNPAQIILKMPAKGQTVVWSIPNEPESIYTASWTNIIVEGKSKRAIKVSNIVKRWKSKTVSYYVQGIGLMNTNLVHANGEIKPFEIFDGLSNSEN